MDIVALGELLIDFTQNGISEQGMKQYERNPGGAPSNMLVAAGNLGCKTALIGKVGDDMHGHFLRDMLHAKGTDVSNVIVDPEVFTTLAFVNIAPNGERSFSFARKPGADTCLKPEEVDMDLIKGAKVFHFGSLSLTDEPARSATTAALRAAKDYGVTISFDPNYREVLWQNKEDARAAIEKALPFADIIKCSDEECELVTGIKNPIEASKRLTAMGKKIVVVTLGRDGALVRTQEGYTIVPAFAANAVDTTGAGDAFMGGFLAAFIKSGKSRSQTALSDLAAYARVGNAVACLCVQGRGGMNSMPDPESVEKLLNE